MKYGIIGALDAEVALVREKMNVTASQQMLGTTFITGTLGRHEVVLVCCGIGKVNAAVCAHTVIREFGAEAVINIGIAGAMAHGLHVMDVVLSTEAGFHDQDPVMLKYYPQKEFFPADAKLLALGERACGECELHGNYCTGRIVTGDVFVNDAATKQRLVERYAPACTEMEGAAIAHACYMNATPFLIIRTMSDSADDEADCSYDNFIDDAAHQSARIVLKMLELS